MLRSPDPVAKVIPFYVAALERGGWRTLSSRQGGTSARLVARRGAEGVTITITPAGRGSSIAVETYRA